MSNNDTNKTHKCGTPPFSKNDIIQAEITATGSAGEGIARYGGMAVFIPAAAEGDIAEIRIVKVLKNMAYGRIERMIAPSPHRVEPDCPVFPKCGGCVFRHISYEAECRLKLRRVSDAFERIGGLTLRPDGIVPGRRRRCRNKAQYPCGMRAVRGQAENGVPVFGFYARHSHRIIECGDCLLQPESFAVITEIVSRYMLDSNIMPYDEITRSGTVRHLYLRSSSATGELMICVVCAFRGKECYLPNEDVLTDMLRQAIGDNITILININNKDTNVILGDSNRVLYGSGYIIDTLLGLSFRISPLSFFQVNRDQAQALYSIAGEYAGIPQDPAISPDENVSPRADVSSGNVISPNDMITPDVSVPPGNDITPRSDKHAEKENGIIDTLLDMYCGTGTIGLTMAHGCRRLIGVEVIEDAVRDARANAALNGIANAEFICADAAEAARSLKNREIKPDVVLLDPPRKGCAPALLQTVASMTPDRIVYISCDPATLARDLAVMQGLGYVAVKARAVDMFPGTGHVETVCLLTHSG